MTGRDRPHEATSDAKAPAAANAGLRPLVPPPPVPLTAPADEKNSASDLSKNDAARASQPAPDGSSETSARSGIKALRLSLILSELVRTHGPAELPAGADAVDDAQDGPASEEEKQRRKSLRQRYLEKHPRSDLSIGEMVDSAGHAGFGFLCALLALMAVPIPGVSVFFGSAIALGALQMAAGFTRPWLPAFMRRYRVSVDTLNWISVKLTRWTAGLEKWIRPRFELLTRGPFWNLCGVAILLQAVALALPLPIPWSNVIFIIPIIIYAIALLEADGLLMMIGHAITIGFILLCIAFWHFIKAAGIQLLTWIGVIQAAAP